MSTHDHLKSPPTHGGYLVMKIAADDDDDPNQKIDLIRFFVLENGCFICYDKEDESNPGSGFGDGENLELEGYTLEPKSPNCIILIKEENEELLQVELEVEQKHFKVWCDAFRNHMNFINKTSNTDIQEISSTLSTTNIQQSNTQSGFAYHTSNTEFIQTGIPETVDENDESEDPERCYGYVNKGITK